VISPYSLRNLRWPWRSRRSNGCSNSEISGTITSAMSASFSDIVTRMTTETTTCARFWIVRVATSASIAFACSVSVRMRAMICPALVRENQESWRRCIWRNTVSRKSRVIRSCSDAPSWPPSHRNRFLTTTITTMITLMARNDAILSLGTMMPLRIERSRSFSHVCPSPIPS
jgi:hypothetical protein